MKTQLARAFTCAIKIEKNKSEYREIVLQQYKNYDFSANLCIIIEINILVKILSLSQGELNLHFSKIKYMLIEHKLLLL